MILIQRQASSFDEPNGVRYPLVGGTRECHFAGINSKPRKLPEIAQTPTTMVSVLFRGSGARCVGQFFCIVPFFHFMFQ